MSAATGLGPVEMLVLASFESVGAVPESRHIKNMRMLDVLEFEHGIAPAIGYRIVCEFARADLQHLRLVDFHGNNGSPDFGPAAPRYTESRLTPLGIAALDAERGTGVRLPIGLVNGNMFMEGRRPPLDPRRAGAALRAAAAHASDDELAAVLGPPEFPTQCRVEGDFERLVAGERVDLVLRPRLTDLGAIGFEAGHEIRIDSLPPTTGASEIAEAIAADPPHGVRDVNDSSAEMVTDLRVSIDGGVSVADVVADLEALWPMRMTVPAWFGAPIGTILREWVDPLSASELERALASIAAG